MWDLKRSILTHGVEQSPQKAQTKYKKDLNIKVCIVCICVCVSKNMSVSFVFLFSFWAVRLTFCVLFVLFLKTAEEVKEKEAEKPVAEAEKEGRYTVTI